MTEALRDYCIVTEAGEELIERTLREAELTRIKGGSFETQILYRRPSGLIVSVGSMSKSEYYARFANSPNLVEDPVARISLGDTIQVSFTRGNPSQGRLRELLDQASAEAKRIVRRLGEQNFNAHLYGSETQVDPEGNLRGVEYKEIE